MDPQVEEFYGPLGKNADVFIEVIVDCKTCFLLLHIWFAVTPCVFLLARYLTTCLVFLSTTAK